jgi:hypothetical protein
MANNGTGWDGWHHSHLKTVSDERGSTDMSKFDTNLYNMALASSTPTMSAQEVQNTVNNAAAAPAAGGTALNNAANNAALAMPVGSPLTISGMGLTGGRTAYVPGTTAYNNVYNGAMETLMNGLLNQKPFQYDVNADGLYQQIKDNYIKQGRQTMMDTEGQSAALTGGYGNSYGVSAGQQAYQESLGNLAGMIPELQQLAFQQYQQEQNDKRNNLEALNKLESQEYARWMDENQQRLSMYEKFPELLAAAMAQSALGIGTIPNEGAASGAGGYAGGSSLTAKDVAAQLAKQGVTGANGGVVDPNALLALQGAQNVFDLNTIKYMKDNNLTLNGVNAPTMNAYTNWLVQQNPTENNIEWYRGNIPGYQNAVQNGANYKTSSGYNYQYSPKVGGTNNNTVNKNKNNKALND